MILIRASQAHKILTEPKKAEDKKAGNLSETTKSYIKELWLYNNFGYKEDVMTEEMYKGLLVEDDSLKLVQSNLGGNFRIKNIKNFTNNYISGTPDIILDDVIEDVKSSFTIKTFFNSELSKDYYTQGQCYMALTGIKKYRLIYCLVETPSNIVCELKKRIYYKFDCDETNSDYIRISQQIEKNHDISLIEQKKRTKVFSFDYDEAFIENLYNKVEKAREYYNTLSL
jgi:hypothetical protein